MEVTQPKDPLTVTFTCSGQAVGKMRNDLDVRMTAPMEEHFTLATDEGPFHGGDATAPPPDAGIRSDAGTVPPEEEGCGGTHARSDSPAAPGVVILVGWLFLSRRRRWSGTRRPDKTKPA